MPKIKHEGKSKYRNKDNPLEKAFASGWAEQNRQAENGRENGILAYLLGDGVDPVTPTQDQATLAATVVQWLGSPVGQGFLVSVLSTPAGRDLIEHLKEGKG